MQEDGRGYRPLPSSPESRGHTRSTGVTIARVALERGTAARAVARGARQAGAALGTELGVGLGAGTVGGTRGTHPPFHVPRPRLRAECRQGCRRVFGLQFPVIAVGEFPRHAIEFDLFQRPERDGAGIEVVLRALAHSPASCSLIPVYGWREAKERPPDDIQCPHW